MLPTLTVLDNVVVSVDRNGGETLFSVSILSDTDGSIVLTLPLKTMYDADKQMKYCIIEQTLEGMVVYFYADGTYVGESVTE